MEYKKYEFCKDIDCPDLVAGTCQQDEFCCVATAKELHKWIDENGYSITKTNSDKILEIVDTCFHYFASDYRDKAKRMAKKMLKE